MVAGSSLMWAFELGLDIGHTQEKFGALSCSCKKEYNYNKSLGEFIQNYLGSNKNIHISTNAKDNNVTFDDRYALAVGKDLFISLHHDSTQPQFIKTINGCPHTSYAFGYSIFVSRKNQEFSKSLEFATKFANKLRTFGLNSSSHHAEKMDGEDKEAQNKSLGIYFYDDLKVLKNAKSPAFLFEAGVIVNCKDEKNVESLEFRKKIADAISSLGD